MKLKTLMSVETTGDLIELSVLFDREGFKFMWVEDARKTEVEDLSLVGEIRIIEFMNGYYIYGEK